MTIVVGGFLVQTMSCGNNAGDQLPPIDAETETIIVNGLGPEYVATYRKGLELVHTLNLQMVGDRVTLRGAGVGWGDDLRAQEGVYVRIINPEGKSLSFPSLFYVAFVTGKVLAVFPDNKLIVLEVVEKDWIVHESA